jgi:NADH-quinone oxidoreductase subunit E
MVPETYKRQIEKRLSQAADPREMAIEVMLEVQQFYGWFSDEALEQTASLLHMSCLELEELATFYNYIYREPVGRYVIHICDSVSCWMTHGYDVLVAHMQETLGIQMGQTTPDAMFTLLPVCCIGYCDRAPAIMINNTVYGRLTPDRFDQIIENLRQEA